jgi:hypothetical protein
VHPLDGGHPLGDALGQRHAAGGDPEQHQVGGAAVALEDLVGDAGEGPADVTGVEDDAGTVAHGLRWCCRLVGRLRAQGRLTSFSASRDGSLKDVDRRDSNSGAALRGHRREPVPRVSAA